MTTGELGKMTKAELLKLAKKANIKASPNILKGDLIKILQKHLSMKGSAAGPAGPSANSAKRQKKPRSEGKPAARTPVAKGGAATKPAVTPLAEGIKPAAGKAAAKPAVAAKPATTAKPAVAAAKKAGARKVRPAAPKTKPAAAAKPHAGAERPRATARALDEEKTIRQRAIESKYRLTEAEQPLPPVDSMKIPASYEKTRIVMMVRDPHWLFAYWEISAGSWREMERSFGDVWSKCRLVLRVYDRSASPASHFDIEPGYETSNWYLNVSPARIYQAAIGIIDPSGRFTEIAVSNLAETPRDTISDVIDDKWLVPDEIFERIFAASGGYDKQSGSGEMRELLERFLIEQMGSESVSSFGSAELQKIRRERGFRLWVATELILYGATEPDARVTIQGKEIRLRGDGTFSARFALPDGPIDIPVTAVSADGAEERTVETSVKKKSREKAPVIR